MPVNGTLNVHRAEFIKSAASPGDFIRDGLPNLVFAGRSNVGKSSVINSLLLRKSIAKVGGQPGKTIHINYFKVDGRLYFVDLPGYGYAKVSKSERDRWGQLMEKYFASGLISCGIHIVDARHAPSQDDVTMANWFLETGCKLIIVANKSDKLRPNAIPGNLRLIRETLALTEAVPVVPYSAVNGTGRRELIEMIESALELADD